MKNANYNELQKIIVCYLITTIGVARERPRIAPIRAHPEAATGKLRTLEAPWGAEHMTRTLEAKWGTLRVPKSLTHHITISNVWCAVPKSTFHYLVRTAPPTFFNFY